MDRFIQSSSIVCKTASVSSDQPRATSIGMDILQKGGNAADAAVATMMAVSVIQPLRCGLGGDLQCLFFRSRDKQILATNGSGRTGRNTTLERVKADHDRKEDPDAEGYQNQGLWASVPGAVAGIFDIVKHCGSGKLTMEDILAPVIQLAEEGTPVPYKTAMLWELNQDTVKTSRNADDLLIEGKAPKPGDIITAPKLAQCLKDISVGGAEVFYCGDMAQRITKAVQEADGVLTLKDLEVHLIRPPFSNPSEAICVDFNGFKVWEMKPNTIGIVVLVILNILKGYDLKVLGHNSAEYIHLLVEATKQAFLECWEYLCDPKCCPETPLENLLSEDTTTKLKCNIDLERTSESNVCVFGGGTSFVAVVDEEGNGCSLICSVASAFGTGIIPDECGFVIHNRARCMSLDENSTNVIGPSKLPVHSLIPAIVTDASTGELLGLLGVTGRWMQPQAHVQIFLNMVIFGMDPQVALNQPRFILGNFEAFSDYRDTMQELFLEGGIAETVVPCLEGKGHICKYLSGESRATFGKGNVIARPKLFSSESPRNARTWWSGSDPRSDGCAMGV